MPDRQPTPEQEEQVRRLLAEARHSEPLPGDVADRLDRTLDRLVADRAGDAPSAADAATAEGTATVGSAGTAAAAAADELAARRRRRRLGGGLLAAAAAVVAGIALPMTLAGQGGMGGMESATTDEGTVSGAGGADSAPESAGEDAGQDAPERSTEATRDSARALVAGAGPVELESGTPLRRQLREVAPGYLAAPEQLEADARTRSWCPVRDAWGSGDVLAARYDGLRAVLVRRDAAGGRYRVDLYLCGEDEPRRTATVRAR